MTILKVRAICRQYHRYRIAVLHKLLFSFLSVIYYIHNVKTFYHGMSLSPGFGVDGFTKTKIFH